MSFLDLYINVFFMLQQQDEKHYNINNNNNIKRNNIRRNMKRHRRRRRRRKMTSPPPPPPPYFSSTQKPTFTSTPGTPEPRILVNNGIRDTECHLRAKKRCVRKCVANIFCKIFCSYYHTRICYWSTFLSLFYFWQQISLYTDNNFNLIILLDAGWHHSWYKKHGLVVLSSGLTFFSKIDFLIIFAMLMPI